MALTVLPFRAAYAFHQQLRGLNTHRANAIYLEYKNVTLPGDTVAIPAATRDQGLEYYNSLGANIDFVRAPISSFGSYTVQPGYEAYFAAGEGNILPYTAITAAVAGELGRPFAAANNSKVYGLALVAAPVWADRTKDIVLVRYYYDPADQVLKGGTNFAVTFPHFFG